MRRNGMVPRSDFCVRLGVGTEPTDPSKRNIRPRCRPEASGQIDRIARNAAERLANRTGQELISTRLSLLTVTVAVALLCRPPPGPGRAALCLVRAAATPPRTIAVLGRRRPAGRRRRLAVIVSASSRAGCEGHAQVMRARDFQLCFCGFAISHSSEY